MPFKTECNAVEQVIEWEISGPLVCKSCATQEDIFPSVVVGEASVAVFLSSRNSLCYCSNREVAPREAPILIPKLSVAFQPAWVIAFLDASKANKTESSKFLYFASEF